ncbi:AAA family ATPase [Amnibacterium kyonggiense]|uniref:ATPase family protein associated with various cellular activities (AAA) n=1 Tax=Amnibacterium kyonggiense TaxID=595671 RepID=A0A4R7FL50_9MICO|nr:AAA family ATPase [Amnibacterium kyonggiense]TDS77089.1 ATPase family protein associated with various cellular activities (AAA) [Amnibacterium kyonggiense]
MSEPLGRSDDELMAGVKRLIEIAQQFERDETTLTRLGERIQTHLGVDVTSAPVLTEVVAPHRLVDLDIAMDELGRDGELLGVRGQNREHEGIESMLANRWAGYDVGAVDFALAASGPKQRRRIVAFGIRLLRFEDRPLAVLQRTADRQHGREQAAMQVLAGESEVAERFVATVRRLMHERSVLRGQVLTLTPGGEYQAEGESVFVEREAIPEDEVVMPAGVLDSVRRHVLGIAEHREVLLAAGRHLKRGVLLYGPPGTGKTLTVRHLIGAAEGTTVVLLTGPAIRFINDATDLARGLQPAMVVLEDIDLVAMDRGHFGPQPLLFAVLDALDGLDGDADVTFLMTTNRVDVLERALAQRPGRVDLAVEVPRPGAEERVRLFALSARGLPIGAEAVRAAAERADGTTASFAKELFRRTVLTAAVAGRAVTDDDLGAALDAMLAADAELTRSLLGMGGAEGAEESDGGEGFAVVAGRPRGRWTAYNPR